MNALPSIHRRILSALVGLFALWQMVFLILANVIDFVPLRAGPYDLNPTVDLYQQRGSFTTTEPLQRSAEIAGKVLDFWTEVTGQDQGWRLFAGGNPAHSLFQAIELHFPDGEVVELRSRYEPSDLRNPPIRTPMYHDRIFNYEVQVWNPGWYCSAESLALVPEMWSRELPKTVRDNQAILMAWITWNLKQYAKEHPERGQPAEVVIKFRYIPTPLPVEPREWTKPITERPYCRWKLGTTPEPGYSPLEGYDPVKRVYLRLPLEDIR